ncbi:hypothetical protein [Blastomonas sp. AAP25]|nr:hypothetical protein [Blastomonas sp. AAP25]
MKLTPRQRTIARNLALILGSIGIISLFVAAAVYFTIERLFP